MDLDVFQKMRNSDRSCICYTEGTDSCFPSFPNIIKRISVQDYNQLFLPSIWIWIACPVRCRHSIKPTGPCAPVGPIGPCAPSYPGNPCGPADLWPYRPRASANIFLAPSDLCSSSFHPAVRSFRRIPRPGIHFHSDFSPLYSRHHDKDHNPYFSYLNLLLLIFHEYSVTGYPFTILYAARPYSFLLSLSAIRWFKGQQHNNHRQVKAFGRWECINVPLPWTVT